MLFKAGAVVASVMICGPFPIRASEFSGGNTESAPVVNQLSVPTKTSENRGIENSATFPSDSDDAGLTVAEVDIGQPVPSPSGQSKQRQGVPGLDATTKPGKTKSIKTKGDEAEEDTKAPPATPAMPKNPSVDSSTPAAGSSSKVGPVTDDQKMIKPVAGETKGDKKGDKAESSKENTPPETANATVEEKGPLSETAVKVATDLKMIDSINQLRQLKRDRIYVPGQKVHSLEVVSVRQDLDEVLFSALLQARRVISELDRQISGYDAVARVLEEKRDQAIRYNNIINFTSGGALAMTQGGISIGTPMKYQNVGNELGVVAGGLTALISAYALKIQKGGKRSAEKDPNMLAPIFGLMPAEPSKYPPVVWNYLNDKEPGQKKTRREQLIERWIKLDYIEPVTDKKSPEHMAKLAGTVPLHKEVTIDLLRDRIPMLDDLRSTVTGINESLDEILTFIRQP